MEGFLRAQAKRLVGKGIKSVEFGSLCIEKKEEARARTQQVKAFWRPVWVEGEIQYARVCAYRPRDVSVVDCAFRSLLISPRSLFRRFAFVIAVMECEQIKDVQAGMAVEKSYVEWFIGNGSRVPWWISNVQDLCYFLQVG